MANSAAVNSTVRIIVKTDKNNLTKSFTTQGGPTAWYMRKLSDLFGAFANGSFNSNVKVTVTAVAATGTITLSSIANNDTVTVNGRVYTAKTSGASGLNQFNIGGSDTAAAANLAAAINADTSALITGSVSASAAAAVVTVTCLIPGYIGNLCSLAISAHGSVSGALLTGGSEGSTNTFAHGL